METIECKCKKSSVEITVVGEDLFSAIGINSHKVNDFKKGTQTYICNICGETIDNSDLAMMIKD